MHVDSRPNLMQPEVFASAITLLVLGAISPGPSLAIVIGNTITAGRWSGVACAVGHGLGLGIYAFAAMFGLAWLMRAPVLFSVAQVLGACLLVYLAYRTYSDRDATGADELAGGHRRGFVEGFAIAVLNPKIAVFFLAVFSAVLTDDLGYPTMVTLTVAAWLIDTSWYALVAVLISTGPALTWLKRHGRTVNSIMAALFLVLAAASLWRR